MQEIFNQIISQYADTIILGIIAVISTFVGRRVNVFLKEKHLDSFAAKAVKYAEDYLSTESGQTQFKKAADLVAKEAQNAGLKSVTGDKLSMYVQAAYRDMKVASAALANTPAKEPEEIDEAVDKAIDATAQAAGDTVQKVGDLTIDQLKKLLSADNSQSTVNQPKK